MKKRWISMLLLLAAAGCASAHPEPSSTAGPKPSQQEESAAPDSGAEKEQSISLGKSRIHQGDLVLVNKEHAVPSKDGKSDVVNLYEHKELLEGYGLLDNKIRLSESVAKRFIAMVKDGQGWGQPFSDQQRLSEQRGAGQALPRAWGQFGASART